MKFSWLVGFLMAMGIQLNAAAAVILQYHHVSDETPPSTSISPEQFEIHLQYLADNNFKVVPLSTIVDALQQKEKLPDRTVAITFDDAFIDILTNAAPLLEKYNFPFTIFVNSSVIDQNLSHNLSWPQLKNMAAKGTIIANHGEEHNSLTRIPKGLSNQEWFAKQTTSLLRAEQKIKQEVGQSWQYFAYPYGEYTPEVLQWIKQNGFVGFTQQSGAVGFKTKLTTIPRYPVSKPYDSIAGLRDKLNSLPLDIEPTENFQQTVYRQKQAKSITFTANIDDFRKSQLNCYISGLGRQKIHWEGESNFSINFNGDLPLGRVRCNCTAPSISEPGRYYWFSQPWFVIHQNGDWYSL